MASEGTFRIQTPAYGGNFYTGTGGAIPFVLPGELVQVNPLRVVESSDDRVTPGCMHFGTCGGCQYQHARYTLQVELKLEILNGLLGDALPDCLPPVQEHHREEWHYRNRIRMRVERGADGIFAVGYSRRASNEFLPVRMCPIAAPLLWRAVEGLLAVAAADQLCRRWLSTVSEVELFTDGDESRLQMQFFLREPGCDEELSLVCEQLRERIPELAGAGAELDPELGRRVRKRWSGSTWGAAGLSYKVNGRAYWVSRGGFFQVNRYLAGTLVDLVCGDAAGSLAWDLFAGVGLFTRVLAERFGRVVAVEAGARAARDLLAASKSGTAFEAVQSTTLDFLRARELQRERPELIVLDPPRAGLGVEGAAVLARLQAPRLVYVSCDPVTLARDLAILDRSYKIDALDLIDLFPETFHMETVVHLSRR